MEASDHVKGLFPGQSLLLILRGRTWAPRDARLASRRTPRTTRGIPPASRQSGADNCLVVGACYRSTPQRPPE